MLAQKKDHCVEIHPLGKRLLRFLLGAWFLGLGTFTLGLGTFTFAQQIPLYSQYYYNPFVYNPALAGSEEAANVFLIHRAQWLDIPGHPVTTAITMDGPLPSKNIGLGVSLYADETDYTNRLGGYGTFAYTLNIGDNQKVMFGVSIGALENRIDFAKIVVKDVNDPLLFTDYQKKTALDGTFGLGYKWKNLQFGVAVPQILASTLKYSENNTRAYYQLSRHYMASLQYQLFVNQNKDISITPLVLVRYMPEAPLQYDANLVFNWRDIVYLAVSYRSDYAIGANARVKINNKISIGYTYDIITGSINNFSGISHELMLGYSFGGGDKKKEEELQEKIDSLTNALSEGEQETNLRYNELIAEADSLFGAGMYLEAKTVYDKALALKPNEQYPKDKIAEIESLLNDQYLKVIANADSLFNAGKYSEAKAAYNKALSLKPNEQYPKDKIAEIDRMLGGNYSRAIAKADSLFTARDYDGARKMYEEALKYKPGDEYATDRISKIDKIKDLFDKRYNKLIQEADSLFMAKEFKLAREKYEDALKFNPNSRYPKDMIAMIDSNKFGSDIRMTKSTDFVDEFGNPASKGFYVVMASFKSKPNADNFKKKNNYKSVYNKERDFHYVYMNMKDSYDESRDILLNQARKAASDSWIYILR